MCIHFVTILTSKTRFLCNSSSSIRKDEFKVVLLCKQKEEFSKARPMQLIQLTSTPRVLGFKLGFKMLIKFQPWNCWPLEERFGSSIVFLSLVLSYKNNLIELTTGFTMTKRFRKPKNVLDLLRIVLTGAYKKYFFTIACIHTVHDIFSSLY